MSRGQEVCLALSSLLTWKTHSTAICAMVAAAPRRGSQLPDWRLWCLCFLLETSRWRGHPSLGSTIARLTFSQGSRQTPTSLPKQACLPASLSSSPRMLSCKQPVPLRVSPGMRNPGVSDSERGDLCHPPFPTHQASSSASCHGFSLAMPAKRS